MAPEPVDEAPEDEDVDMDADVLSPQAVARKAADRETARGEGMAAPSSRRPFYGREACRQATPLPTHLCSCTNVQYRA